MLLFATPSTSSTHKGIYYYSELEGPFFSIKIGADDFDGTWGRIDHVLKNGDPIYFKFADDEHKRLSVAPNTEVATKLARAHFGNLDERFKQIRAQLLDENSDLSRELRFYYLLDDPEIVERLRGRYSSLRVPTERVVVRENGRTIRRNIPISNPEVLRPEVRAYLTNNYSKVRAALIDYLESGETEFTVWTVVNNLTRDPQRPFHFYIKLYLPEVDSSASLYITKEDVGFTMHETGPLFGVGSKGHNKTLAENFYNRYVQFFRPIPISSFVLINERFSKKFLYFTGRLDGHFSNLSQEELMARNIKPEYRYLPTTKSEMAELPKLERPAPRVPDNIPQYLRRRQ